MVSILKNSKTRRLLSPEEQLAFWANGQKQKVQALKNNLEAIKNEEKWTSQALNTVAGRGPKKSKSLSNLSRMPNDSPQTTINGPGHAASALSTSINWLHGSIDKQNGVQLFDTNH